MKKREPTVRVASVDRLMRIGVDAAYASLIGGRSLDPRSERQIVEYVSGVTRWRRWLDFLIDHYHTGPSARLNLVVRQVLRIGVYDILFLSTPNHAAVNEAVETARTLVGGRVTGLVNAILRSIQRAGSQLPVPDTGDSIEDLSIRQSHPTWIVRKWIGQIGLESTSALLEENNKRPRYSLRINTLKTDLDAARRRLEETGVVIEPGILGDFVRVERLQPVVAGGMLGNGLLAVQDEGAALVVALLNPRPGEIVVDACAAPGGKSLYAAARMANEGRIIAVETYEHRLKLIRDSVQRYGASIVETLHGDFVQTGQIPIADRVLVDTPCTGLGVLSKRPDLRWRRNASDIDELCRLQDALLDRAAEVVRVGGVLVYSTCTILEEENEKRISAFLTRHSDFDLETAAGHVPDEFVSTAGFYVSLPHIHGLDGAFGARLRRRQVQKAVEGGETK